MSRAAVAQVSFTRGSSIRCHFWRWWLKYSFAQVAQILVSTWLRFSLTFTLADPILADAICDRIVHDSYSLVVEGKESMRKRKGIVEDS